MSDERERLAEELRRIREAVRDQALLERKPEQVLPAAKAPPRPEAPAREPEPSRPPAPVRPDGKAVTAAWEANPARAPRGLAGVLARLLRRLLAPRFEAQVAFNSHQVQLDNAILEYIDARLHQTHQHYDGVLGILGKHMEDIDTRHLILQEELVAHVHDLVKRIDLVLSESERGRLGLESALRDLRSRLQRLEERLGRP